MISTEIPIGAEPYYLLLVKGKVSFVAEFNRKESGKYFTVAWKSGAWAKRKNDPFRDLWIEWEPLEPHGSEWRSVSWFLNYFDQVQLLKNEQVGKWKLFFDLGRPEIQMVPPSVNSIFEPALAMRAHHILASLDGLVRAALGNQVPLPMGKLEIDGGYRGKRSLPPSLNSSHSLAQHGISDNALISDYMLAASLLMLRNRLDSYFACRLEQFDLGIGLAPVAGHLWFTKTIPLDEALKEASIVDKSELDKPNGIIRFGSSPLELQSIFEALLGKSNGSRSSVRREFKMDKESDNQNHLNAFLLAVLERSGFYVGLSRFLVETNQMFFIAPAQGRTLWIPR